MKILVPFLFAFAIGGELANAASAAPADSATLPATVADTDADRQRVAEFLRLPSADIQVRRMEGGAVIEVVYLPAKEILYVDQTLRYVLQGSLMDGRTATNVTQERRDEITAVDFAALPLDKAIKIVRGDGRRRVAIFEDPDCPYCRRLEKDIVGLENVTMYVFLFPLTQLHPEALARATSIYCAKDQAAVWSDYLQRSIEPPHLECPTPMSDISDLAQSVGVSGTPTLFFEDGRRASGAIDPTRIDALMKRASARIAQASPADAKARKN